MGEAVKEQTQDEMRAEATALFGENPAGWRFVCPNCGDVASIQEFVDLDATARAGQECIGRNIAPTGEVGSTGPERGCNWTAYGLLNGPVAVKLPTGATTYRFRFEGEPDDG